MAISKPVDGGDYARNAGSNLSAKLFYFAKVDTDGDIILCGDGEHGIGVITEAAAADSPVTVQTYGIAKITLGGTVASGARVASDASGTGVTAAVGDFEFGTCLVGGDAGAVVPILLQPGRRHA